MLVANLARTQADSATTDADDARADLERLFTLRDNAGEPLLVLVKRYRPLDARDVPSGRLYALAVAGAAYIEEMVYPQPDKRPLVGHVALDRQHRRRRRDGRRGARWAPRGANLQES